jgi:hypothetical protein
MNINRRIFLKTTGTASAGWMVFGLSVCDPPQRNFKLIAPVDGDMLTDYDGEVTQNGLLTKIKISAPQESTIRVNGTIAKFDNGNFVAEVLLKDYSNELKIVNRTSGYKESVRVFWLRNIAGKYRFSLDDNILFLKDINSNADVYKSIFENPYLGFLKQVHDKYGTKIHMNIYYQTEGFNLSQMTDKYKNEWKENAGWLKLSFHALQNDPDRPYINAGYDEVKRDCEQGNAQIRRFAGDEVMGPVTTLHWGAATLDGCRALRDSGYIALAGYFVVEKDQEPVSYYLDEEKKLNLSNRIAWKDNKNGIIFSRINIVINSHNLDEIVPCLNEIKKDPHRSAYMDVMIHEQYFHPTYIDYQPDYREKVMATIKWVVDNGYKPAFLSEVLFA